MADIKLVINIKQDNYDYIKTLDKIGVGECLIDNIYEAIRQGVPLEKVLADIKKK